MKNRRMTLVGRFVIFVFIFYLHLMGKALACHDTGLVSGSSACRDAELVSCSSACRDAELVSCSSACRDAELVSCSSVCNGVKLPCCSSGCCRHNAVFQGKENLFSVEVGQSLRSEGLENLFFSSVRYSQPTLFFRLPSKRTIELGSFNALSDTDLVQYDQKIFGLMEEAIFDLKWVYLTLGLGFYIKSASTDRIGSKFTFGQRIAIGRNFANINVELYARHFSNGSVTEENFGQNFVGFSLGANF